VENFCKACVEVGVDGCIVPDLPMAEYEELYESVFAAHGLSNIFLVTPQTSTERIHKIDGLSNGFIYLLSSSATTGQNLQVGDTTEAYFSRIADLKLKNPTMIGFGISSKETFDKACQYANGAIIGSAFVKALDKGDIQGSVKRFIKEFRP
jgi:tryptophan synthase alpha chain